MHQELYRDPSLALSPIKGLVWFRQRLHLCGKLSMLSSIRRCCWVRFVTNHKAKLQSLEMRSYEGPAIQISIGSCGKFLLPCSSCAVVCNDTNIWGVRTYIMKERHIPEVLTPMGTVLPAAQDTLGPASICLLSLWAQIMLAPVMTAGDAWSKAAGKGGNLRKLDSSLRTLFAKPTSLIQGPVHLFQMSLQC